jgi:hypothetical protein
MVGSPPSVTRSQWAFCDTQHPRAVCGVRSGSVRARDGHRLRRGAPHKGEHFILLLRCTCRPLPCTHLLTFSVLAFRT